VLSISRVFVKLRIEHCRVIEIKFLIIVERFVERRRNRKKRKNKKILENLKCKKIEKVQKITNFNSKREIDYVTSN